MPETHSKAGPAPALDLVLGTIAERPVNIALTAIVLVLGTVGAVATGVMARSAEQARARTALYESAMPRIDGLEYRIRSTIDAISIIAAHFEAQAGQATSRQDFAVLTAPLLSRHSYLQAVDWVPLVRADERTRYERLATAQGMSGFSFVELAADGTLQPASARDSYFPALYVEPLRGNERVVGFDLASSPVRMAAIEEARDMGRVVVTPRVRLVRDVGNTWGVLLIAPVYSSAPPVTVAQRRAEFRGLIACALDIGDLVESGKTPGSEAVSSGRIDLSIRDLSAPDSEQPLYAIATGKSRFPVGPMYADRIIEVGGRSWRILATPRAGGGTQLPVFPYLLTGIGLFATALMGVYVRTRQTLLLKTARTAAELESTQAELRQTSSMFDAVIQSSPLAIMTVGPENRVTLWNRSAAQIFGWSPDEAIGQPGDFLFTDPGLAVMIQINLQRGLKTNSVDTIAVTRSGTTVPVSVAAAPVCDPTCQHLKMCSGQRGPDAPGCSRDGESNGAVYLFKDITDRREMEKRVAEARVHEIAAAEAEAANRAKTRFLSSMSHEMRTPMNVILGFTQLLLREKGLDVGVRHQIELIQNSGEHLLRIINEVLDLARIESGRMEVRAAAFSPVRLINELESSLRRRIEAKGLQLVVNLRLEASLHVLADDQKIRQVLINLLENSLKFTNQGFIRCDVSLENVPAPSLLFSVTDTGSGIAPEEQGRVFTPFEQSQSGLNVKEGTGLGLSISRKFARIMGGDLTFTSEPERGSTFDLVVPVEVVDGSVPATAPRVCVGILGEAPAPRILVVDDVSDNREWVLRLLRSIGFEMRECGDGLSALDIWRKWEPDAILLDIHLPEMDGMEVMDAIRNDISHRQPTIIALTASAWQQERRRVLEHGADDFLAKPCRENDLLQVIARHLHLEYRYREEEEATTGPKEAPASTDRLIEDLRQAPPEQLGLLELATQNGDSVEMLRVIEAMTSGAHIGAAVAVRLRELVETYQYDELITIVGQARQPDNAAQEGQ